MASEIFKNALKSVPKDSIIFADKSLDILDQVQYLLEQSNMTQKTLAKELGKSESEISKWLSGLHNMTLKTISKLEAVFEKDILVTPIKARKKYSSVKFVPVRTVTFKKNATIEDRKIRSEVQYRSAV